METKYPDQYLHVTECHSGQTWIVPFSSRATLDLKTRLVAWIKQEFCGEARLDGKLMPGLDGDYYGKIMTDNRPPDSVVCWQSGGFYLKVTD